MWGLQCENWPDLGIVTSQGQPGKYAPTDGQRHGPTTTHTVCHQQREWAALWEGSGSSMDTGQAPVLISDVEHFQFDSRKCILVKV